PLPCADVERVVPNEDALLTERVTFEMERLAELAQSGGAALHAALRDLPELYGVWIDAERRKLDSLLPRQRQIAEQLIADMEAARRRIAAGIELLVRDERSRCAFRLMNLAVSRAAW